MRPPEVIAEKAVTQVISHVKKSACSLSLQKDQFLIEKILSSTTNLVCLYLLTYHCHIKTIPAKQSVKMVYDL